MRIAVVSPLKGNRLANDPSAFEPEASHLRESTSERP